MWMQYNRLTRTAMPVANDSAGNGGFDHSNCMWVRRVSQMTRKNDSCCYIAQEKVSKTLSSHWPTHVYLRNRQGENNCLFYAP